MIGLWLYEYEKSLCTDTDSSNTVTDTVTVSVTATVTDHDDHIATTIDTARFKCECCGKMYQLFIRWTFF